MRDHRDRWSVGCACENVPVVWRFSRDLAIREWQKKRRALAPTDGEIIADWHAAPSRTKGDHPSDCRCRYHAALLRSAARGVT